MMERGHMREREREMRMPTYTVQSYKQLDITETERALNAEQTIESATFVKDIVSASLLRALNKP